MEFGILVSPNPDDESVLPEDYVLVDMAEFLFRDNVFAVRAESILAIPPFEALRDYFLKGCTNHGMNAYLKWIPFQLSEEQYYYIESVFRCLLGVEISDYNDLNVVKKYDHWMARSFRYLAVIK